MCPQGSQDVVDNQAAHMSLWATLQDQAPDLELALRLAFALARWGLKPPVQLFLLVK